MLTLIKNAHLVSPDLEMQNAAIVIAEGKIAQVLPEAPSAFSGKVIDAAGKYVMPGFVDVHCHGRNNFDFCDGDAEKSGVIIAKKLEEGVTTLLPTTLTVSKEDLKKAVKAVADAPKAKGCKVPGVHLEGPFINPKCCGAQNPGFVRTPDIEEVLELNDVYPIGKITYAIEMPGAVELTAALLRKGITPSCTHSAATYQDFCAGHAAGLRNLSHFCNQMTALHHRDIGLVGAGLLHKEVFAEFICDKLHISPAMIKLVFQIKGPEHVVLITDAMRAAGMPNGNYTLGGLPVIVKDGAARLAEGGALAGSTLQLNVALKNVWEVTGLPLKELVKSSGYSAATALGLKGIGKIEAGYCADIVMLNGDFSVAKTLVDGEVRFEA